jgi:hypothetical protein
MKYNNFDKFKLNESQIMDSNIFSKFEYNSSDECEKNIFDVYKDMSIVIELKRSKKCYVYTKKGRNKYWDIDTIEKNLFKSIREKSLLGTENGQLIKQQYEKLSGLTVNNVYLIKLNKDNSTNHSYLDIEL